MQSACSPSCAQSIARKKREASEKKQRQAEARQDRAKREALKTKPELTKEAQREFNRFIRLRDTSQPCICCGNPLVLGVVGGGYDAGHYRSVGSAPSLRFNEDNVHAQRKVCNRWGAGRAVDYRMGLIQRIGLARVEALEADNEPRHYTRDELRAIRDEYRRKANELAKRRQSG